MSRSSLGPRLRRCTEACVPRHLLCETSAICSHLAVPANRDWPGKNGTTATCVHAPTTLALRVRDVNPPGLDRLLRRTFGSTKKVRARTPARYPTMVVGMFPWASQALTNIFARTRPVHIKACAALPLNPTPAHGAAEKRCGSAACADGWSHSSTRSGPPTASRSRRETSQWNPPPRAGGRRAASRGSAVLLGLAWQAVVRAAAAARQWRPSSRFPRRAAPADVRCAGTVANKYALHGCNGASPVKRATVASDMP